MSFEGPFWGTDFNWIDAVENDAGGGEDGYLFDLYINSYVSQDVEQLAFEAEFGYSAGEYPIPDVLRWAMGTRGPQPIEMGPGAAGQINLTPKFLQILKRFNIISSKITNVISKIELIPMLAGKKCLDIALPNFRAWVGGNWVYRTGNYQGYVLDSIKEFYNNEACGWQWDSINVPYAKFVEPHNPIMLNSLAWAEEFLLRAAMQVAQEGV